MAAQSGWRTDHPARLERIIQLHQRADGDGSESGTAADVHAQRTGTGLSGVVGGQRGDVDPSQPTSLASSTAPAQIRTLPNGHLLAVWNQESEDEIKRGYNRTRISAAISRNGGSVWEFFQNVESMHEETRVEPGPIRPVRPAEYNFDPGLPAPEREREHILPFDFHGRWSYPSVFVMEDRVLITHTYSVYEEHPTRAELILSSQKEDGFNQKLKVLPLTWFYGGKEPSDNPVLARIYEQGKAVRRKTGKRGIKPTTEA